MVYVHCTLKWYVFNIYVKRQKTSEKYMCKMLESSCQFS